MGDIKQSCEKASKCFLPSAWCRRLSIAGGVLKPSSGGIWRQLHAERRALPGGCTSSTPGMNGCAPGSSPLPSRARPCVRSVPPASTRLHFSHAAFHELDRLRLAHSPCRLACLEAHWHQHQPTCSICIFKVARVKGNEHRFHNDEGYVTGMRKPPRAASHCTGSRLKTETMREVVLLLS